MKFLKTGFGRVHAAVAAVALMAIVLGGGMALRLLPYIPWGTIHGILGISIFPLFLLLPLLSSKRRMLYRAFRVRILPIRADFRRGNGLGIAAKAVTMLMVLMFLMQLITGVLMVTGLTYRLFPAFAMLSFHTGFLYALTGLAAAHTALMLLKKRIGKSRK